MSPLVGIMMMAASTAANSIAARQAESARQSALQDERQRQVALDREAAAVNSGAADRYEGAEDAQDARTSELTDMFKAAPDSAASAVSDANVGAGSAMPGATNDVVTREVEKQQADATAYTDQQAASLAGLRSFGDTMGGMGRETARDAGLLGQISDFKAGSSGVLSHELDAASQKGQGLRTFADILGGAGSMAATAGIANAAAAAPAGTSAWDLLGGGFLGGNAAVQPTVVRPTARPVQGLG